MTQADKRAAEVRAKLAALREQRKHETPAEQKRADEVSNAMVYANAMTKAMRKDKGPK